MDRARFEKLADELASLDPELPARLSAARDGAERLRAATAQAVESFARRARSLGAEQLAELCVTPVGLDEKHTDCLQFSIERGRWVLVCVAIAEAPPRARLVGPFKRGGVEGPCADFPLDGPEAEAALEERALALIRSASGA